MKSNLGVVYFPYSKRPPTTASYIAITKQTPVPRLRLALTSGLLVTALDALLLFGIQRVAADVQRLRAQGLNITLSHVLAFDSQTQTVREIPAYLLGEVASGSICRAAVV